jgi:Uma2 family endonuclease
MTATPTAVRHLLENGERMERAEFHRRYEQCPDLHGVELIEGVVYMPSPINVARHARPQHQMQSWLGAYALKHTGVEATGPATVFLDDRNEPEPDAMLFRTSGLRPDGYLEGAPQLVVEIAHSSRSRDLHAKLRAYERNGVLEYIVWRVEEAAIDWFRLQVGRYERVTPGPDGVIESSTFPGLRLNVPKMLEGEMAAVLAELA